MLTMKIYLAQDGSTASLEKDFALYQGQFNNVLLNAFVPTSLLASNFQQYADPSQQEISPFVAGTSVAVGCRTIARNGTYKESARFYLRYVKTLIKEGTTYALFERKLPKEFTEYAGVGVNASKIILNVDNLTYGEIQDAPATCSNTSCTATVTLATLKANIPAFTYNYVLKYGVGNLWYLNDMPTTLDKFGITLTGTPVQDDTITVAVSASGSYLTTIVTTQTLPFDVLPSNAFTQELPLTPTQLNEIQATINAVAVALGWKQNSTDYGLTTNAKTIVGAINEIAQDIASGENYIGTYNYNATSVSDLPSDAQLLAFARSIKGASYDLVKGDMIIVVQKIATITDKNYKYLYNGTEWGHFEIPAIQKATNGVQGSVEGTYIVGGTADTLVDIQDGKIQNIYVKNNGLYKNITSAFMYADVGATKQFVKDYALPKEFNNQLYFNGTNGFEDSATNFTKSVELSGLGEVAVYTSNWSPTTLKMTLYQKNVIRAKYNLIKTSGASETITPKLYVYADLSSGISETLAIQSLAPITLGDSQISLTFDTNLNQIGATQKVLLDTDLVANYPKLRFVLSFVRSSSATLGVTLFANSDNESYFDLTTNVIGVVQGVVKQSTGDSTTDVMSQNATTQFGTQTDVDLTNDDVLVSYDTTDGIQVSSVAEETRANGDVVHYNVDLKLPIVGQGMSIDKDESEEKIILKPDVRGAKLGGASGIDATVDENGKIIIPNAANNVLGLVKPYSGYFIGSSGGFLYCYGATYEQYVTNDGAMFIGKTSLENVLENETIRYDKSQSLSSTQKAQALSNLGGQSSIDIEVW